MRCAVIGVLLSMLAGCGGDAAVGADGGACEPARYPCGPYGLAPGSTIANLSLQAKRDTNGSGDVLDDVVAPIALADYYATPPLRALVIVIASETCVPCQNEQPSLVAANTKYDGAVAFLEAIVQGQAGKPADTSVIDAWVATFHVPFDMTADPTGALVPYYNASAFPSTLVIRTSDMQLVSVTSGQVTELGAVLDPLVR